MVISAISPCAALVSAEEAQPYASAYICSFRAFLNPQGNGSIDVFYNIVADDIMDDLGALGIQMYTSTDNKNWTVCGTMLYALCPSMMGHNCFVYQAVAHYQGVPGNYYKANIYFRARKGGGSDSVEYWTQPVKAT